MSERVCNQLLVLRDGQAIAHVHVAGNEDVIAAEVARHAQLYPDAWVLAELREEELIYAWCRRPGDTTASHSIFYNDFDDYEDDILMGDKRWMSAVLGDDALAVGPLVPRG